MGQKVNQSIFRLGLNNSEWNYKFIGKNSEESSLLLYKNIKIIEYINRVLKSYNILLHSCKIEYTETSANIMICIFDLNTKIEKNNSLLSKKNLSYYVVTKILPVSLNLYIKNKKINIKLKSLNNSFLSKVQKKMVSKLHFKKFKKILKNRLYKDLLKIMFISVYEKNSSKLLADIIAIYISKHKKKHYYIMSILKNYFNLIIFSKFSKIKGLKIKISGRLNGAPRANNKIIQIGSIPLQSFNSSISYHSATSYTPNGSFGVKVWICQKL